MNRLIISIIAFLLVIIPASAQNLSDMRLDEMLNHATALQKSGKYSEAIDIFSEVVKYTEKSSTEKERQVYVICQILISSCYYDNEQYSEGYQVAKNMLNSNLSDEEKRWVHSKYVDNGYQLAISLMIQNENESADYKQVRALLEELTPYANEPRRERLLSRIALTWYFEGVSHFAKQMFEEALVCFDNALKEYIELGELSSQLSVLSQIASANEHLGNIDKSIAYYQQALSMAQQTHSDAKMMDINIELCRLNRLVGNLSLKNYYAEQIDSIFSSTKDLKAHFAYYRYKGREAKGLELYNLAEQWFQKAIGVAQKQSIEEYLLMSYFDLGDLYHMCGRYSEALTFLQLSLGKNTAINENNYFNYILIADIHLKMGDMKNCMRYIEQLFTLEPYISELRELSQLYTTQGNYNYNIGDYQAALSDYKKADEILAAKYPATDGERVSIYALLGGAEHRLNHYNESEHYYKLYVDGIKEIYGAQSLNYINAQIYLANAQGFAGHIKDGCNNYTSAEATLKYVVKKRLPYMNTPEREGFWKSLSSLLTLMTPYALKAELYQTEYTKTCYDALLLSKAFLLDSERSVYDIIQREGDETDMQTYMSIASMNNQIKEWEKNYAENADNILVTSNKIAQLESSLMKRCQSLGSIASFMDVDYNAVKDALSKNEVLLDFTDFAPNAGGRRYAAYIVNKKQKYPLLKSLFAESQIDSLDIVRPDMFYDKVFATEVIKLLWSPLEEHIPEGATVYYVPSQMLFQICLESLPLEDGTVLGDHYHFVRLSSARELVRERNKFKPTSAILYGGLQYNLEPDVMAENAKQYDLSSLMVMRGGDIVRGDSIFSELPGSKVEVERIAEILNRSKFEVTPYIGMNGTEESFLNMHGKSPQILHLATHGFYYTPTEAEEVDYLRGYSDAMSLSGLIMSGGNYAWRGKELPAGTLGGVLTANNIARLDLSNTGMVVLSACQTGQGNATAEGLYGLQRAFKKAGVGTMVMTLWSVSDKVATEFMIKFYEALVENDWDKYKAFEHTKSYIRTQYPDPYHWAAFVMLD